MKYAFNNDAFPLVTSLDDVPGFLQAQTVRAVILRDAQWQDDNAQVLKNGITFLDNTNVARLYHHDPVEQAGRRIAGGKIYDGEINRSDIMRETQFAAIDINEQAAEILTQRVQAVRGMYDHVLQAYAPHALEAGEVIQGRFLTTPKQGKGRSPMMHVDGVDLTAHVSFAGAPLRLLTGMTTERMWENMDLNFLRSLPEGERCSREEDLTLITRSFQEEFSSASLGDIIFMKGQKGRDFSAPEDRAQMCIHASSPYIEQAGQVAALYYAQVPQPAQS